MAFLILMDLTSFLLSFVLWSLQVLGKVLMDYGIRSGKSLSLGMPKEPQGRTSKHISLGCPGWHPLFRLQSIGKFTWGYIFIDHMICVLLGASCMMSLCFLVWHNHPCCTHLLRGTRMNREFIRILYVLHLYLLS